MNFRTITAAAALITVGALALTGCSATGSKTASPQDSSKASSTTTSSSFGTDAWLVESRDDTVSTKLDVIDPVKGTVTHVGSIGTESDAYPISYVSGDANYWLVSTNLAGETTIPFLTLKHDQTPASTINVIDTLPGYSAHTSVRGVQFDVTKPHTLVVEVSQDSALDHLEAWGYDVSNPSKTPVKLGSAKRSSVFEKYTFDEQTGLPTFSTPPPDDTESAVKNKPVVVPPLPWGEPQYEDGWGLKATDGTLWNFSSRSTSGQATLFVTKTAPGAGDSTSVGKPIQNLPNGFKIDWARPLSK